MANPFLGIITSNLKELYTNMINSLLEDDSLTVPCRLVYTGSKWTLCPNCLTSPITGRSTNIYNGTGPAPFTQSTCSICNGIGKLNTQSTEIIYMAVLWNYKDWIGVQINSPAGLVQTLSKIDTLDNIKRANEILVDTNIEQYVKHRFQRLGEPNAIGLGASSYVLTMWERI